ncbi:hypothetical protein HDV00_011221 [Rhizophlyctis rosea]|nr:hypothetical protein HDV00_011221 [Rhizophlyctis rosea]
MKSLYTTVNGLDLPRPSNPQTLWASILFVAHFLLALILGISGLCTLNKEIRYVSSGMDGRWEAIPEGLRGNLERLNTAAWVFLPLCVVVCSAVSCAIFEALRRKARVVVTCGWVGILVLPGVWWMTNMGKSIIEPDLILLLVSLSAGGFLYFTRGYAKFTHAMAQASTTIIQMNRHLLTVSAVIWTCQFGLMAFYMCALVGTIARDIGPKVIAQAFDQGSMLETEAPPLDFSIRASTVLRVLYLVVSAVWTTAVIQHVAFVTLSSTFATHYLATGTKKPISQSIRRALTSCFGPICLGSLRRMTLKQVRGTTHLNVLGFAGLGVVMIGFGIGVATITAWASAVLAGGMTTLVVLAEDRRAVAVRFPDVVERFGEANPGVKDEWVEEGL